MAESVDQYLARGGRIKIVPWGKGTQETANKGRRGEQLRARLHREAQNSLVARATGCDK